MIFRSDAIALVAVSFLAACTRDSIPAGAVQSGASSAEAEARPFYTCPMHPEYRSDRPGDCPICNMKLVLAQGAATGSTPSDVSGRAQAAIPVDLQKRIGLATSLVERGPFTRTIRAAGRVEVDERRLSAVSLRYGGWIEELAVRATGETVRTGDKLFSIYSPELFEAQRTYLAARAALPAGDGAVASARERLLLWDMTEAQIVELEARGGPERATPVLSKVNGTVSRREAMAGLRVEAGTTLFEIADLSALWVIADVYEADIPLLAPGLAASIELASSAGKPIAGRIAFLYPTLSDASRTAQARIEVENADGKLRPGEYATVSIDADLGDQLTIDLDAVIDTGTRKIAYVDSGEGLFDPREVTLGARGEGRAIVLSGLEAGERVVTSATFLVDSESRLRSAAGGR